MYIFCTLFVMLFAHHHNVRARGTCVRMPEYTIESWKLTTETKQTCIPLHTNQFRGKYVALGEWQSTHRYVVYALQAIFTSRTFVDYRDYMDA
jgi:hypothetical protein